MANGDPAGSFASVWSDSAGGTAKMRLVAGKFSQGIYHTAVEIKLAPSAHTYWRQPGEAGVPPVFSFAGSTNLGHAEVLYPTPQRLDEAGFTIFGYRGAVTFPIEVKSAELNLPTKLNLTLRYAVCDRICVPAKAHAALVLPRGTSSPEAGAVEAAEARVPVVLPADKVAKNVRLTTLPSDQGKPRWRLTWNGRNPALDLFAEAPEGWYIATHKHMKNSFVLIATERPSQVKRQTLPVHLTIKEAAGAYQFTAPLTLRQPTH